MNFISKDNLSDLTAEIERKATELISALDRSWIIAQLPAYSEFHAGPSGAVRSHKEGLAVPGQEATVLAQQIRVTTNRFEALGVSDSGDEEETAEEARAMR